MIPLPYPSYKVDGKNIQDVVINYKFVGNMQKLLGKEKMLRKVLSLCSIILELVMTNRSKLVITKW